MKTRIATGYLTVKPVWAPHVSYDGSRHIQKLVFEKVTSKRPTTGTFGAVVVKLAVEIPEHVFRPVEIDAQVLVKAEELGVINITVEPFPEEGDGQKEEPE